MAFGATSGYLRGRIAALFFRYRSIGGYDDITDFLIAPGPGQHGSQPGDSGTVWHLRQTADDGSAQLLPDRSAVGRSRTSSARARAAASTSLSPRA